MSDDKETIRQIEEAARILREKDKRSTEEKVEEEGHDRSESGKKARESHRKRDKPWGKDRR